MNNGFNIVISMENVCFNFAMDYYLALPKNKWKKIIKNERKIS